MSSTDTVGWVWQWLGKTQCLNVNGFVGRHDWFEVHGDELRHDPVVFLIMWDSAFCK